MHGSKLFEVFDNLNSRQFKRLQDFAASPYFNKSEPLLHLLKYVAKFHPSLDNPALAKEKIKKQLRLTDQQLVYQMNQLLGITEQFLITESLAAKQETGLFALLDVYDEWKFEKHYKTAKDKLDRLASDFNTRNADYFNLLYNIQLKEYEHKGTNQRVYNPHLQQLADRLDLFYLAEKLRINFAMTNLQSMLNVEYRISHLEETLHLALKAENASHPVIIAYRAAILLLLDDQRDESFLQLKEILIMHPAHFSQLELMDLYTCLLNICTRKINRSNDAEAWENYFNINEHLLESGLLLEDGYLNPWRYTNLTATALKTDRTVWALNFIKKYKKLLPDAFRNDMFHYCMAQYHFHLKQFHQAHVEIIKVAFTDVYLNIAARSLMIKIYYEKSEDDLLFSLLEATRIFLLRNKLIDENRKKQMQRFIEFTHKLARYESFDTEKLAALKDILPAASAILHHAWLTQKLAEKMKP
jgi:hypothetical protein